MPFLPTSEAPFGIVQPIHEYILHNATPISSSNWYHMFIIPLIPLGLVTCLVQYPNTRSYRLPIAVLGTTLILHAGLHYRFDSPYFNAFNNGLPITILHLVVKYLEYGLIEGPMIDPRVERGERSKWFAGFDLAGNSRMIGLGMIDLSQSKQTFHEDQLKPKASTSAASISGPDGGVAKGNTAMPSKKLHQENWLPYTNVERSRLAATIRHITHAVFHYTIIDVFLQLLWYLGGDNIGSVKAVPNALDKFLAQNQFYLLPNNPIIRPIPVPSLIVESIVIVSVGVCVWQGISWGYHTLAALAVGSFFYEVDAWEVDLFDSPLMASSLLDMWGRRWHQFFRHHFLLLSTLILSALRLPLRPPFAFPLIFFFSGMMHSIGEIGMDPVPNPSHISVFFFWSGVGCALEAAFRGVTGKRVRGAWGRLWMWTFFLVTAKPAVSAWLDSGIGGSRLVPIEGHNYRPGPVVVDFLIKHVLYAEKK